MTPEGKVKKKVTDLLKKLNVYYFFPATGGYGKSGVPDIVCCPNGLFVGIECKHTPNTTTALQQAQLKAIEMSGGKTYVVNELTFDYFASDFIRLVRME
jgi:Holliday junction resolvase